MRFGSLVDLRVLALRQKLLDDRARTHSAAKKPILSPLCLTQRWEASPNPEWALIYRRGLTRRQIAKLVGGATSTVGYYLAAARADDPDLRSAHESGATLKPAHTAAVCCPGGQPPAALALRFSGIYTRRRGPPRTQQVEILRSLHGGL